jgi:CrcB protein
MRLFLLACAGGALGSGARYLVNTGVVRWIGLGIPWATLTVNIVGSFLMGIVVEFVALRLGGSLEMRTFLATGILGGFTTFSAFSLDAVHLYENGASASAAAYVVASVLLSILALIGGMTLARTAWA